jgi:hypothetical protein
MWDSCSEPEEEGFFLKLINKIEATSGNPVLIVSEERLDPVMAGVVVVEAGCVVKASRFNVLF